uniref:Uncharacterized protein n=1 Tax=Anguilla anguilla TaxID=7936 RepID=A0A0E9WZH5_ANGAN
MFPRNGVQQAFRSVFSRLVGVSEVLPNQQRRVHKPRRIKKAVRTMDLNEVLYKCVRCSWVYATTEDIRRHVCHKYFIVLNTYLNRFHQAPKILRKERKEWPSQLP